MVSCNTVPSRRCRQFRQENFVARFTFIRLINLNQRRVLRNETSLVL